MSARNATLTVILTSLVLSSGCDGRVLFAGNIVLATIPCVLLWLTVNLQKTK